MKFNILIYCILGSITLRAQNISKTMLRLPDTGETMSYTNTFGEDHDFLINPPFFVINANGTVLDTVTGLMWQQTDGGEMTYENAIEYCKNLNLGSFQDWRLPDIHEAFSILNHQYSNPALDQTVFTSSGAEYWWSSDRQLNDSSKVWVSNSGGGIGNHPKKETISAGGSKKFHVRAVRLNHIPLQFSTQFIDNGNQTITDVFTQLTWQKIPNTDTLTWEQALAYANSLELGGSNDWRIPNIKELQSLHHVKYINPAIQSGIFQIGNSQKFWSSTTLPNQNTKAWYMNTQFGITSYDSKTLKHYVICVTNNQLNTGLHQPQINPAEVLFNPFHDYIAIKNSQPGFQYNLKDVFGHDVFEGERIELYDFSNLPNGLYILSIIGNGVKRIKLIKE